MTTKNNNSRDNRNAPEARPIDTSPAAVPAGLEPVDLARRLDLLARDPQARDAAVTALKADLADDAAEALDAGPTFAAFDRQVEYFQSLDDEQAKAALEHSIRYVPGGAPYGTCAAQAMTTLAFGLARPMLIPDEVRLFAAQWQMREDHGLVLGVLAGRGHTSVRDTLYTLWDDPDPAVRVRATGLLAGLGDRGPRWPDFQRSALNRYDTWSERYDLLEEQLRVRETPEQDEGEAGAPTKPRADHVAQMIGAAVWGERDEELANAVFRRAERCPVSEFTVMVLGCLGDRLSMGWAPGLIRLVLRLLQAPNPLVAEITAIHCAYADVPDVAKALRRALTHADPRIRSAALTGVGRCHRFSDRSKIGVFIRALAAR
jgi:hypothetical protein